MEKIKITAKNGQARPVNPYAKPQFTGGSYEYDTKWKDFESTVQWHDCPEATEDKEYWGVLTWKLRDDWKERAMKGEIDGYNIWLIVSQPQEKKTMENYDIEDALNEAYYYKEKMRKSPYKLIANERTRKAEKYGYDTAAIIERTEDYGNGELSAAAACYCIPILANEHFPWEMSYFKPTVDNPTTADRIKELVKSGAFIVDEIIRLQNLCNTIPVPQNEGAKTVEWKTAEEILADAHGILPQYLNVHIGRITVGRNIEAMQSYSSQQNIALMEENAKLREALAESNRVKDIYVARASKLNNRYGAVKFGDELERPFSDYARGYLQGLTESESIINP